MNNLYFKLVQVDDQPLVLLRTTGDVYLTLDDVRNLGLDLVDIGTTDAPEEYEDEEFIYISESSEEQREVGVYISADNVCLKVGNSEVHLTPAETWQLAHQLTGLVMALEE